MPRTPDCTRGTFTTTVVGNEPICDEHFRLTLAAPGFPPTRPGQFVQLQCRYPAEQAGAREVAWPAGRLPRLTQPELAGKEPLLRRPFSLAGRRDRHDGSVELDIIYRTIGTGTRWLAGVRVGDRLSVLGPLGNAFGIRPDKPLAALVGGGVGIPPIIYLAEALARAGKETIALSGTRTAGLLPLTVRGPEPPGSDARPSRCVAEFSVHGAASVVATDDGSAGFAGLVSDAFRAWLDERDPGPEELVVYSCGPEPMMQAVGALCIERGIECRLALERHMACGMGTCQSCVVKIRDDSERGWSFRLCCTDGPVFDAAEVFWQ